MKKPSPSKTRDDQPSLPLEPPSAVTEVATLESARPPTSSPPPSSDPAGSRPARRATAEMMATRQREISVSEFFTKNRHLLGFDNPAKALLTTIKEAVDNSLDACEEAGILPDIRVECVEISEGRFRVAVEDNGPGIVKQQVPKIFGKLLYGSKFHRLKQSRGQQGIGISAAGLYAQLTTGKPIVILSKTGKGRPARRFELRIDTRRNAPEVLVDQETEWETDHGTRVELELSGTYRGGRTSIDAYLEQTVVANPHLKLSYILPRSTESIVFERASEELPREPMEIKPHPHGVELGLLISMVHDAKGSTVKRTLIDSFSRVSSSIAEQVCASAGISPSEKSSRLTGDQIEALHRALGEVKVLAPPASCVVPIGEPLIEAGLRRRFPKAEFVTSVTRPPSVYRGNPFVIECALAYGGDLPGDEPADVMRFANRVPLQYQPKACAMTEAIYDTNWKAYELQQPRGSLPIGPLAVLIHLASVWVPFTSEAKEAVAHYPELLKEMRLALQECGRKLGTHLRARSRVESALRRRSVFERYIPEIGLAISKINGTEADKISKIFLEALPSFVGTVETEDSPSDDSPPSAPSTPSMPPPADVVAEEPPDNGAGKKHKAAEPVAVVARKPSKPTPEPEEPPEVEKETARSKAPRRRKAESEPPAKPPAPAAKARAEKPSGEKKEHSGVRDSRARSTSKNAAEAPAKKGKQPTTAASSPSHKKRGNGRQLELVR